MVPPETVSPALTAAQRWGVRLVQVQIVIGITVILFLLLDAWAARRLSRGGGLDMAEHAWWQESDSYAATPWLGDYVNEFLRSRVRWTPYIYWQRRPMSGPYINVDDVGRRLTVSPTHVTCSGREVMVAMYGGSTTWGEGVRDAHTVPSEVQRLLREAGVNARVVNEGEGGYVSTQEMIKFQLRFRAEGRIPDAVVFLDGLNDIYSTWENRTAGVPQNESNRAGDFNLGSNPIRMGLTILKGGPQGWSIFRYMAQKARRPDATNAGGDAGLVEQLAGSTWRVYEQNVRMIRAVAATRGVPVLFFWQPSVYDKQRVSPFEERVRQAGPLRLQAFYRRTYEMAARTCGEKPELGIYDLGRCFGESAEPRFIDFFHLNEQGNAEVAAKIVEQLLPVLRAEQHAPVQ